SRIAVRRHPTAARRPFALFTFLERQSHPRGSVFAIAVTANGQVLDDDLAQTILSDASAPGEAAWAECERLFAPHFASVQTDAAVAARNRLASEKNRLEAERQRLATVLRQEASLYKVDRLAEIEEEERAERVGAREQMQLFRDSSINWQARRAAVE